MGFKPWGEQRFGASPTQYQSTGQYRDSYINLYGYRSRWYDQSLGRFIQPDTLVPDPGDPVAFDRYHYSRNSPLRYVDPSGHGACNNSKTADPEDCKEAGADSNGEVNPLVVLTSNCNFIGPSGECYDGQMMYDLYQVYLHTPGWWNNYGKHAISIRDFLKIIIFYELMGIADNDYMAEKAFTEAINHKLIFLCEQYGDGSCGYLSDNAILNFIATRGSAWKRYDAYVSTGYPIPTNDNWWDINTASNIVNNALIIDPNWGFGRNWDWGNLSMFSHNVQAILRISETGYFENQVVWKDDSSQVFVLTDQQLEYWK
jgi:RHS repeat-associated protein